MNAPYTDKELRHIQREDHRSPTTLRFLATIARLQERVEEAERRGLLLWEHAEGVRREGRWRLEQGRDNLLVAAKLAIKAQRERDEARALAERRKEALVARERAQLVKEEYYRQCDLGQPPSKGWEKISFIDVTSARLRADELARAAIEEKA